MKNYFLIICFIISVVFFSCTKPVIRDCCALPSPVGIYGQKDGKTWFATSITDTTQFDGTSLYARTDSDMLKFKFATRITYTLNVYEVPQNYEVTYYVTKGTHSSLTYVLDSAAANNIKVAYGTGKKAGNIENTWIFSNFNLTFKLATPTGNAAFDNKRVNFSNGTIHYGLQN